MLPFKFYLYQREQCLGNGLVQAHHTAPTSQSTSETSFFFFFWCGGGSQWSLLKFCWEILLPRLCPLEQLLLAAVQWVGALLHFQHRMLLTRVHQVGWGSPTSHPGWHHITQGQIHKLALFYFQGKPTITISLANNHLCSNPQTLLQECNDKQTIQEQNLLKAQTFWWRM